jgi:hypothetical protein
MRTPANQTVGNGQSLRFVAVAHLIVGKLTARTNALARVCLGMQDTKHFRDMLKERSIDPAWADATVTEPDHIENESDGTRHYLKQIPEYGNR